MYPKTVEVNCPSDFHTHLRSPAQIGTEEFKLIVKENTKHYEHVVVEPNTFLYKNNQSRHIFEADDIIQYRLLVLEAEPDDSICNPHYLLKLTPETTPSMMLEAKKAGAIGIKLYPDGVTTGSEHGGISDFTSEQIMSCLKCAESIDWIFQIHPEMPIKKSTSGGWPFLINPSFPKESLLRQEKNFHGIIRIYAKEFPKLRIFVEHMTDRRTVDLVRDLYYKGKGNVFGTITAHHLYLTLDDVFGRVDHHCKPCAKHPVDREALVKAATSGLPCYIYITDSAPHEYTKKHLEDEACAGVFCPAEVAIPAVFQRFLWKISGVNQAIRWFEQFTSGNGLWAYKLPRATRKITLVNETWEVPKEMRAGTSRFTPFLAGKKLEWKVRD